ncbi:MAG TPA: delta-60 repeat domain-containing protein [Tepidisphaeraceae bacterium]|nr:delta-60 repeat domain-containing protein [Tepidisphaeraceae bacterium]
MAHAEPLESRTLFSALALDAHFGTGGAATFDFSHASDQGFSTYALSDGKTLVAGSGVFNSVNSGVLARLNADGTLDLSFGTGGFTVAPNSGDGVIAVDATGDIYVAGGTWRAYATEASVTRYHADGSLDTSFGTGGIAFANFVNGTGPGSAGFSAVAVQQDGKIVAVGMGNSGQMAAARYNADGSLDSSFAYNGTLLASALNNGNYTVHATSDGGFEVAGAQKDAGVSQTVYYGRFDQGGNLVDSATFDGSAAPNPVFSTVAFAPDGGLVVAGATYASAPGGSDPNWYLTGDVLVAKFDVVAGPTNGGGTMPGGGTDASGGSPTGGTTTDGGSTSGPTSTDSGSGTGGTTPGGSVTGLGVPTGLVYSVALVHPLPVMHLSSLSKSKPGKLYRFTVTYTSADNQPIATLDVADISVAGPAGWQGTAQVIKSHQSHHGKRRNVTYAVQLPPGTSAAGLYTLTSGAAKVGAFTVVGRTKKASH